MSRKGSLLLSGHYSVNPIMPILNQKNLSVHLKSKKAIPPLPFILSKVFCYSKQHYHTKLREKFEKLFAYILRIRSELALKLNN